jgi:hypothetical protein
MNVEIETEAAQFPEKECINGIFLAVWCTPFGRSNLAGDCLFKVGSLSCLHVPALPTALVQTGASVLAGVVYICGGRDSSGTQASDMHVQHNLMDSLHIH